MSRHLCQSKKTLDGNFHCTKAKKNSDPNDRSLFAGTAFFPTNEELNDHLAANPEEKGWYQQFALREVDASTGIY